MSSNMTSSADYKPPATAADAATTGSGNLATSNSSTMASQQQQQQQQPQIHNHLSSGAQAPHSPNLGARIASVMIMGLTGVISRTFLYGFNDIEVKGLDRFKQLLDGREDPERRERGLLTVSNHISVLDDPVVWGVLPLSYAFNPNNLRWTLAAHDICFANPTFSAFFTAGQVLPCHRLKHSQHGGLFQPALTQAIRLLSSQPFVQPGFSPSPLTSPVTSLPTPSAVDIPDPFTIGTLTYSTTGLDSHPSPSIYTRNRHSWVHVFPEGLVHQHPQVDLRYFKWGVARLILESEPAPDVVPMFIDGTQQVMNEERGFPRFLPRIGKKIRVAFGEVVDYEATFGDLRRRWRQEVERVRLEEEKAAIKSKELVEAKPKLLGDLPEALKYSEEAQQIRIECARRMREQVLKVRRELGGYDESDPTFAEASTWAPDRKVKAEKYKSRVDGSEINQD
ncbi:hypothetical protein QBC32DRAFT_339092 [Pseudoneurospora amorphoporcata]|uniref:Tafazzin family protein n=1 Tax=Pseudoneurospora amorphoporcata TaxID=241081 RepID=A0AAN6NWC6_9PEZI|nr:hypothetical protein QBC32DRAFT_339092 [Pseudoneurospora amorphoporcata]